MTAATITRRPSADSFGRIVTNVAANIAAGRDSYFLFGAASVEVLPLTVDSVSVALVEWNDEFDMTRSRVVGITVGEFRPFAAFFDGVQVGEFRSMRAALGAALELVAEPVFAQAINLPDSFGV